MQNLVSIFTPPQLLTDYVEKFNRSDFEHHKNMFSNADAECFMRDNIPLLHCPDKEIEQAYYFRWWTFRKHIRETEEGVVITEFLPDVKWAKKHNVISCPSGHHVREGRWLRNPEFVSDYMRFLLKLILSMDERTYSYWAADCAWAFSLIHKDDNLLAEILPGLEKYYQRMQAYRVPGSELYHYSDMLDGMENTAGGRLLMQSPELVFQVESVRPTVNSYQYGDACALANIKEHLGQSGSDYRREAQALRSEFQQRLWNKKLGFFTCLPEDFQPEDEPVDVREQIGFIPWYFHLPEPDKGYESCWRQLMDSEGFSAPFGPTTCEQRHPFFELNYENGSGCQWCGPSWPFATSQTLTALANLLHDYEQDVISETDYFETLKIYAASHHFRERTSKGEEQKEPTAPFSFGQPWIDESIDPRFGNWLTRDRIKHTPEGEFRGKDYNHSTFCDLVINGLIGIRPEMEKLVIHPLTPPDWEWFCLEKIPWQGHLISVIWDRDGTKYEVGAGLHIYVDDQKWAHSDTIKRHVIIQDSSPAL